MHRSNDKKNVFINIYIRARAVLQIVPQIVPQIAPQIVKAYLEHEHHLVCTLHPCSTVLTPHLWGFQQREARAHDARKHPLVRPLRRRHEPAAPPVQPPAAGVALDETQVLCDERLVVSPPANAGRALVGGREVVPVA